MRIGRWSEPSVVIVFQLVEVIREEDANETSGELGVALLGNLVGVSQFRMPKSELQIESAKFFPLVSRLTNNDIQKANLLNDYFASVFTHEPHGYVPSMDSRTNKVMLYEAIKNKDIESLLKNMDGNKAPSPDGYHPCFVKELAEFISEPLGIIFRNLVESGNIPTQWKEARVSAIHKKGNQKLSSNYRPVSITSVLCRILEKLVRNQIAEYMQSKKLFSHLQFGFLKGWSTSLQLLNIMNDWTSSIENGTFNDCIYLDYQKAFDTVPHNRLISKLYVYNLDAKIIKWIKYYLSEKKQFVEINGKKSEWQNITSKMLPNNVHVIFIQVICQI